MLLWYKPQTGNAIICTCTRIRTGAHVRVHTSDRRLRDASVVSSRSIMNRVSFSVLRAAIPIYLAAIFNSSVSRAPIGSGLSVKLLTKTGRSIWRVAAFFHVRRYSLPVKRHNPVLFLWPIELLIRYFRPRSCFPVTTTVKPFNRLFLNLLAVVRHHFTRATFPKSETFPWDRSSKSREYSKVELSELFKLQHRKIQSWTLHGIMKFVVRYEISLLSDIAVVY